MELTIGAALEAKLQRPAAISQVGAHYVERQLSDIHAADTDQDQSWPQVRVPHRLRTALQCGDDHGVTTTAGAR